MKRRGFLGILGGAAAAGPAVAKEALSSLPTGMGDVMIRPFPGSAGYEKSMIGMKQVGDAGDWRLKEIEAIRRFLSGDLTEKEREDRRCIALEKRQSLISQNVASLASVSSSRKLAIYNERLAAHHDDVERIRKQSYLQHLLSEVMK